MAQAQSWLFPAYSALLFCESLDTPTVLDNLKPLLSLKKNQPRHGSSEGEGSRVSEAVCNSSWDVPASTAELCESHFAPVTVCMDTLAGLSQMRVELSFMVQLHGCS